MFGLTPFRRDMKLLNDFFYGDFMTSSKDGFNVDIKDLHDRYLLEAEIPGVAKEDIKLNTDKNALTISISTKKTNNLEEGVYIKRERKEQCYSRSFQFEEIDENSIKAKYRDGILTVEVPKNPQKNTNKNITIE